MAVRKKRDVELPPVLADIADVIGLEATIRLAAAVGGTSVYIPARLRKDHWLTETVGREAAERLCGHFTVEGGCGIKIGIPLLPKAIAVHVLTAQRMSARQIAHKLGITERTVVRARNETTLPAASGVTLDPFCAISSFIFQQLGLTAEDVQRYGADTL